MDLTSIGSHLPENGQRDFETNGRMPNLFSSNKFRTSKNIKKVKPPFANSRSLELKRLNHPKTWIFIVMFSTPPTEDPTGGFIEILIVYSFGPNH